MTRIILTACVPEYAAYMRCCLSLFLLIAAIAGPHSPAFGCTVCHSKNPKMVRMHEALQFKNCFVCHKPGGIGTGPGLNEQRVQDQRCVACHAVQKGSDPDPAP